MKMKMYQVDAFTDKLFGGNPAAVCLPDSWPEASLMQQIAMENNLAETAFVVKKEEVFEIRWFTPTVEVDLCGHATLAAAYVLFNFSNYKHSKIAFYSPRSGMLKVKRNGPLLTLDFPADHMEPVAAPEVLISALHISPLETFKGRTDYMAVLSTEQEVLELRPDFSILSALDARGLIVTARGSEADFVSRFFAPQSGIEEDPVTGSAHTSLTPYWAKILGRDELTAIQLSSRRGYLTCKNQGARVEISGHAIMYMEATIEIP